MPTITEQWTDNVAVLPATTLSYGGRLRATLDLRTKRGAFLFVRLGRKGTAAPASPIKTLVRRLLNNGGPGGGHPAAFIALPDTSSAAGAATTVSADSLAGQNLLSVASIAGFALGDLVCIYDAAYTRLEFGRISSIGASWLVMDAPLGYSHTAAQGDGVSRLAELPPPVWLGGGALWELVVDYGAAASGSDYAVQAVAQTYDSDLVA
ncbi:MAG: hypothetical protein ACP5VE_10615 [Chthonomonadales bacterium]